MISKYTSKILSIFLIVFTAYNAHGQGTEDFGNLTTGSSQYSERSWTGQDGSTWTATKSRTDETIDGNAICMNDDHTQILMFNLVLFLVVLVILQYLLKENMAEVQGI